MKKYIYIALAVIVGASLLITAIQSRKISTLKEERDRYIENTAILNGHIETYKTKDSLNAARVKGLELTLEEYENYRAADAVLIKSLKQKNRDLQSVNDIQSRTIIDLRSAPRDTVIFHDSIPIKAKAVQCGDPWYDFQGIMTETEFAGKLETRDSLIIAETVRYKRFLFWKTHKVKDRQIDAVSKCPYTQIMDIDYILIEK